MAAFPVGVLPTNNEDTGLTLTTAQYRDASARRGGSMMLVAAPNVAGPAVNPACAA